MKKVVLVVLLMLFTGQFCSALGTDDPERLIWHQSSSGYARCIRAINDVDGDGVSDVVVAYNYAEHDNFFCLSGGSIGTAIVIWSLELPSRLEREGVMGNRSIMPGFDADGNGYQNILVGNSFEGVVSLDSADGSVIWTYDTGARKVYVIREMEDVTGDGIPEVIFGCTNHDAHAFCIDGSVVGSDPEPLWSLAVPSYLWDVVNIEDISGDGVQDVLVSCGLSDEDKYIYAVSGASVGNATVLWSVPFPSGVDYLTPMEDINGNGSPEFAGLTLDSVLICGDGADGSGVWWKDLECFGRVLQAIQDITGDHISELVVSSLSSGVWCFSGADGSDVWHTQLPGDERALNITPDLNNDGVQDVVVGSRAYSVYCLSGADGSVLWDYDTGNEVKDVFPSDDLNRDGIPDILVATKNATSDWVALGLSGVVLEPTPTPAATPTATPTCIPTGVTCDLNQSVFNPGDPFIFNVTVCNGDPEQSLNGFLFVLLDVGGMFFFYPSWSETPDYSAVHLDACECQTFEILNFVWPETGTSGTGICFYAALVDVSMTHLVGEMCTACFDWH